MLSKELFALAICYQHGLGVDQDYKKSTVIHQEIAESGNPIAQYEIGCFYFIGRGVRQNSEQTRSFLSMAAEQGNALTQLLLGNIYWNGIGIKKNEAKAVLYYQDAAKQKQAESARKLGCAYHTGRGVSANLKEALFCWQQGFDWGDCVAAYNLSFVYRNNESVKDRKLAFSYMQRAAELGDLDGMRNLALAFFQGDNVERDIFASLDWCEKAAEFGCSDAMYFMFDYYQHQPKQDKNPQAYLVQAAEAGYIFCQMLIVSSICPFEFDVSFKLKTTKQLLAHS